MDFEIVMISVFEIIDFWFFKELVFEFICEEFFRV